MSKSTLKNLLFLLLAVLIFIVMIAYIYEDAIISINILPIILIFFTFIITNFFNKYKKEINNPFNLFLVGWLIPLALSQIKMSYLQIDFSDKTWSLIIISTLAFLTPLLLYQTRYRTQIDSTKYNFQLMYIYIVRFYILSIVFIIFNWIIQGGIPLLNRQSNINHLTFAKGFSYFINLVTPISGLAVLYLGMVKKHKLMCSVMIITPYLFSILQTQRSVMFIAIYYQVNFLYLILKLKNINTAKIKQLLLKRGIILFAIFLFFMNLVGNIRLGITSSLYTPWTTQLQFKGTNTLLSWIYSYYPMNFDNLNHFMNNFNHVYSYGYNVLMPIIGPTQLKGLWKNNIIDYPALWTGATGTYLMKIFGDGGWIFTIIIVFLFGVIVSIVYKKYVKYSDIKWYGVYIVISFGILYMFFDSGAIFDPTVIIYSVIIYLILKRTIKNTEETKGGVINYEQSES